MPFLFLFFYSSVYFAMLKETTGVHHRSIISIPARQAHSAVEIGLARVGNDLSSLDLTAVVGCHEIEVGPTFGSP
ncbi:hypothetical protein PGTUg99_021591 [Puccinia graminis f. sp. tritici]|uniref:Secreted protein n=1 Tax=Puccinia graminis f. sp. tritici TaxID=56615 RepID=A0A5B0RTI4_PUCGR|nr:hypothetical protein PGTUg99_021591 [Puccinia graminis f. sp. tritici]